MGDTHFHGGQHIHNWGRVNPNSPIGRLDLAVGHARSMGHKISTDDYVKLFIEVFQRELLSDGRKDETIIDV